jgi:hypothetical protein
MSDFIALAGRIRASLLDVDVSMERVGLPNCYEAVKKDLIAFAGFLKSID